jgi:GNAT superfamily N-acetyltransferase
MNIRPVTPGDRDVVRELWHEFMAALPPFPVGEETWDEAWDDLEAQARDGVAAIAEDDGGAVAFVFAELGPQEAKTAAWVNDLYVRPAARGRGVAKALLAEVARVARERGFEHVVLEVQSDNGEALAVYERLGFREFERTLLVGAEELADRTRPRERAASFGSIHVQTDDAGGVRRAVEQFVPRIGRSAGSEVTEARNGWVTVYDELADRDRSAQRRLAGELSDRMGAVVVALALEEGEVVRYLLFERGRMVDEYLSVPSYYGPLARVDELSLAANPPLVARLTGAEPARVRAVARNAASPRELPSPSELLADVASLMGLTGADRGYTAS